MEKTVRSIYVEENGIHLVWEIDQEEHLKFLHCSTLPFRREDILVDTEAGFRFVELQVSGIDRPYERHGNKYIVTAPGYRMKYIRHTDTRNKEGRVLVFYLKDDLTGLCVESTMQFYDHTRIIRFLQKVRNEGNKKYTVEYISGFQYEGIEKEGTETADRNMRLLIPHNSWQRECNWKEYTLQQLGMELVQPEEYRHSSNMISVSNTGNWSTKEHLPMAYLENTETGTGLVFQIENNGSWHWEIGDQNGHLYLAVSGPDEIHSHWYKNLEPSEEFQSVPVAVGVCNEGFEGAVRDLTAYRRIIRRPNRDNEALPVIFNDYMNCLWGKPEAEKEIPLIDAAKDAGCEYFCIDAGWYADGDWWDQVGEWQESKKRFPDGLKKTMDLIRSKGMIPGVWLEPEVMGIHCELAKTCPDDWFFIRHGERVYDRSRFQLDYRNPEVIRHMNLVLDRLIGEYGVGYIKMDYNIEPGIGTQLYADSVGDGMLQHERAYLQWIRQLFEKYPELIIENCSSGGLRMDYAMLSQMSIQSTSDQDNYLHYATIAANAPAGVTPEQAAVWTYPMNHEKETEPDVLKEEVVFNMINAMLLRVHQSGHLATLDEERKKLVKEGLSVYASIRQDIRQGYPYWPLGLSSFSDEWVAMGLHCPECSYLSVWRRNGTKQTCRMQIPKWKGKKLQISCMYPSYSVSSFTWEETEGVLEVNLEQERMARFFRIRALG